VANLELRQIPSPSENLLQQLKASLLEFHDHLDGEAKVLRTTSNNEGTLSVSPSFENLEKPPRHAFHQKSTATTLSSSLHNVRRLQSKES
jgi:hypothetical protein